MEYVPKWLVFWKDFSIVFNKNLAPSVLRDELLKGVPEQLCISNAKALERSHFPFPNDTVLLV